jgi:hypothetical protein
MDIDLLFQEPKSADYIYIDDQNRVHILMPIVGGETIGIDNTCKTAMELQTFFHGNAQKASALAVLKNYQKKLMSDIQFLQEMSTFPEIITQKQERLLQITQYISLLTKVQDSFILKDDPYPKLPQAVHNLFNRTNNCYTIHLSPKIPDYVMRTSSPTFSLQRQEKKIDGYGFLIEQPPDNFQGLGPELRKQITGMLDNPRQKALSDKQQIIHTVADYYANKPKPTLEELQEYTHQLLLEKYQQDVNLKQSKEGAPLNIKYLKDIFVPYDECSVAEGIETVLGAALSDEFWDGLKEDKLIEPNPQLSTKDNSEKIANAVQFFLASINVYCKAKGLSTKNFGPILDQQRKEVARRVAERLTSADGAVEEEFFTIINEYKIALELSRNLNPEDKKQITKEFRLHYRIIKESPHFDEFIVFREDMPGDFFNHQNRISISLMDLINHSSVSDRVKQIAAPLQSNLLSLKSNPPRKLRPNNPRAPATFKRFLSFLNSNHYEQIANFFCSQITNSDDLIKKFNYQERQDLFNHPLWPQIYALMISNRNESQSTLYQEAILKAQDDLMLTEKKVLTPCGSTFDSQCFKEPSNWTSVINHLQNRFQSYESRLKYIMKSNQRKSQVGYLKKISIKLTDITSSPLPTQMSMLIQIMTELSHLSASIKKEQSGKSSTLATTIDEVKAHMIEVFHLAGSPIALNWENPSQSIIEYQNSQLGDLVKQHPLIHNLDTQWWSDEGKRVIRQLPPSCYDYETILRLNTTRPEQFNEWVLKAIQTDKHFIHTGFSILELRGRFIQAIDSLEVKEALLKLNSSWWLPAHRDKITAIQFKNIPETYLAFLNNTNPDLLDQRKLKGLALKISRKEEIKSISLESLETAGKRCELLGQEEYEKIFDQLNSQWWNEHNIALIKTINKPINRHLIQFLNQIDPEKLTEKVKTLIKDNWNENEPIDLKKLSTQKSKSMNNNMQAQLRVMNSSAPPAPNASKYMLQKELKTAMDKYARHTQKKWFDFGGVRLAKKELISTAITAAISNLKENEAQSAKKFLEEARLNIRTIYQGGQEHIWSWLRFKYIIPHSEQLLNQLIEKLEKHDNTPRPH